MLRSMTAFERRESQGEWGGWRGQLAWELRSVNHRYLEVAPRLPEELRSLEPAVRERVRSRLGRGKVDCTLRLTAEPGGSGGVAVDWERVEALAAACAGVERRLGEHARPASSAEILRLPGVLAEPRTDPGPLHEAALGLLDEALDGLLQQREREGAGLAEHLGQRLQRAREAAAALDAHRERLNERIRERLTARLATLPDPPEPGRMEEELAYIAQRLDIDEELARLETHLDEVARLLGADEPVGRRLDFLMQELTREANTIASKAGDAGTRQSAVDLKVVIDQMREQVQNVE